MSFRSYAITSPGSGSTVTATLPAGTVASDVLIGVIHGGQGSANWASITPPAGWTLIADQTPAVWGQRTWWAPGNVADLTWTGWVAGFPEVTLFAYSGRDTTAPITDSDFAYADDATGNIAAPAVTAAAGDDIFTHWSAQNTFPITSPPAPLTTIVTDAIADDRTSGYQNNVSAGSQGPYTVTAGSFVARFAVTVALKAAPSPSLAVYLYDTSVQTGNDVWLRDPTVAGVAGATIVAAGIASAEAFGSPAIGVTIDAAGIASGEAFGQPTVGSPAATIDVAGIASGEAFGSPAVGVTVNTAGIATGEAFGSPAVAVVVNAAGITTGEAFGQPALRPTISAAGIASGEAFGSPAVATTISATGIATGEAFGSPALAATINAAGIASGEAFGQPSVGAVAGIVVAGIASEEAFGSPAVGATVDAAGVASGEAFGQPALRPTINAAGIVSGEAFGSPTLAASVNAVGIASGEAFGSPAVGASINAAGIVSAEAFGSPALAATISAAGIASGEAFGQPTVGVAGAITPIGIPSDEAFGNASVAAVIAAASIASAEAFGQPSVAGGVALSAEHAGWIEALARVHGLVDPLVVTSTTREAGPLQQTMSVAGGVTTVTPVSVPSGAPGTSALTTQQALWLRQLCLIHGLIPAEPLTVSETARSSGDLEQTVSTVGDTTTVTTV